MQDTEAGPRKIIVVPRPLEAFFLDRLQRRYAGRDDVLVLIDRRVGERRRRDRATLTTGTLSDRRRRDRRAGGASWSLPDMPLSVS